MFLARQLLLWCLRWVLQKFLFKIFFWSAARLRLKLRLAGVCFGLLIGRIFKEAESLVRLMLEREVNFLEQESFVFRHRWKRPEVTDSANERVLLRNEATQKEKQTIRSSLPPIFCVGTDFFVFKKRVFDSFSSEICCGSKNKSRQLSEK